MPAMELYGGKLPDYLFTIFFAHRLRRLAMDNLARNADGEVIPVNPVALYAERLNMQEGYILDVLAGRSEPSERIHRDMAYTYKNFSRTICKSDWIPRG